MRRTLVPAMALVLWSVPTQADAQFGRLKKLGSEIAKEAGREAAGVPKVGADASSSKGDVGPADYALTPDRVTMVLTSIRPLVEPARQAAAERAALEAFETRRKTWEGCVEDAARRATSVSAAYLERVGEMTEKSTAVMQRYAAALTAGRTREVAFLEDTSKVMGMEMSMLMTGAKCGGSVYKPTALIEADVAREAQRGGVTSESSESTREQQLVVPENARSGLSTRQFGVMRERMAIYALELARDGGAPATLRDFTDVERSALDAHAAELKSLAPFFRDGTLRWMHWGDVRAW